LTRRSRWLRFGRRLLGAVENKFNGRGLGRAWALMTTDNLRAAGLYLSRGYRLVRIHLGAVDRVREHRPSLPETGYEGIPVRDPWEFEKTDPLGIPVPRRRRSRPSNPGDVWWIQRVRL
jgi:hypothetical protein